MRIAADKNIMFAKEAFSTLGEVKLFDLDEITNENIRDFDILLVRSTIKVDENLLSDTKIKFVGSAVAGTDHIDIEYLESQNIGFSSAAGCNARSVAEYVMTVIYAFSGNPKDLCVGIIGVGNTGGKVAEILHKLGIKTLLNDPILEKQGISGFSSLDEIAKKSDIITLHTPLTKSGEYKTEGLLGEDFFAKMKQNALLIQASRGTVCDEDALIKVKNKVIDVWASEPSVNLNLAKTCFLCTPHIAGHSFDGKINGTKIIYENCCNFFFQMPKFNFNAEVFAKIEKQTIEYKGSIAEILLKCCQIDKNTEEFRKLLEISDENERRNIFKKQRENYHKRLEFSHYEIKNTPEEVREELTALGLMFSIV
jgi:erythronate-4-phosphate dehydrogenase